MQDSSLYKNRAGLKALCKKYHVRRLEVFGSAVREDFTSYALDEMLRSAVER